MQDVTRRAGLAAILTSFAAYALVVISGLDPGAPEFEIKTVEPLRGERRPGGVIRAPIIGFDESSSLYTARI